MIVATVQGKVKGEHDTVIDGKVSTGNEKKKAIDDLLSKTPKKRIENDGCEKLNKDEFFCYMEHPERDV